MRSEDVKLNSTPWQINEVQSFKVQDVEFFNVLVDTDLITLDHHL